MMPKKRKSSFLLIFLTFWIRLQISRADLSSYTNPKLNISETSIDVRVDTTLYLQCTGSASLSWIFISPIQEHDGSRITSYAASTSTVCPSHCESTVRLEFNSIENTGAYACIQDGKNASVYIFVNDGSNLLLPYDGLDFLSMYIHQGWEVVIPCIATVSTANVTLWKTDSTDVMIQPSENFEYLPMTGFRLKHATDHFSGAFQCRATYENQHSVFYFEFLFLTETESIPEVEIDDSYAQHILIGQDFSLTCIVTVGIGVVVPDVVWTYPVKDENRVLIEMMIPEETNQHKIVGEKLTVRNSRKTDGGVYQCNVSDHSRKQNYNEVYVSVFETPQVPKVNFTQGVELVTKSKGENVTLTALYTVFPKLSVLSPTWTKDSLLIMWDGRKYLEKSNSSSFVLHIFNLTRLDSGIYTVVANDPGGSANKTFHVRIKDKPVVSIQNKSSCCYIPSENYTFICKIEGYPPSAVLWSWKPFNIHKNYISSTNWEVIDGSAKINNAAVSVMKDRNGVIFSHLCVTAKTSGYLKCIGENEIGTTEEEILFIVTDAKEGFEILTEDIPSLETQPFSATCRASSELYNQLKWTWTPYSDNKRLLILNDDSAQSSANTNAITLDLNFESIMKNDSGAYTCRGTWRKDGTLREKHIYINVQGISAPHFTKEFDETVVTVAQSSYFELNCHVEGIPTPNITWYKDGLLIFHMTDGVFEDNFQKLKINRVIEDDSGEYECKAQNIAGNVTRNVILSVIIEETQAISAQYKSNQVFMHTAIGIVTVSLIISAFILGFWLFRRKDMQRKLQIFNHQLFQEGNMELYDPNAPLSDQVDLLPYDESWEFPKEKLKLGRTVGQGAFGRVVKALAFGLNDYETSTVVAVKMLKEHADMNQQKALMAELKILIHLGHHVNIVNLMGAVTKNFPKGELYLMVEYCRYGNIRQFLHRYQDSFINEIDPVTKRVVPSSEKVIPNGNFKIGRCRSSSTSSSGLMAVYNPGYRQRADSFVNELRISTGGSTFVYSTSGSRGSFSGSSRNYLRADSQEHVITTSDLVCYCFQCARGMEYLASKKLIHRDLAARNILLTDQKIVKICDFGLAKDCYKYENYVKKGDGPLPIKWMSIESIWNHVFTTKSDVWSYGILMWELFTLGGNPYPGINLDEEFYKKLKNGYRMEKPDFCPDCVYSMMQNCWKENPEERPSFTHIAETLGAFIDESVKQHYIDLNAPYIEMNQKKEIHNYLNLQSDKSFNNEYMNSEVKLGNDYDTVPPIRGVLQDNQKNEPTVMNT